MIDKSLVAFITAGDPNAEKTLDFMSVLENYVDVIELGIPFSDPVADGKTIQKANVRALKSGFRVNDAFRIVERFKKNSDTKVVLMTYYNPVFVYGVERFVEKCADSGVDGMIIVDLPADDGNEYVDLCIDHGIKTIFIASPNTPDNRLKLIDKMSTGFVYLTSDYGTTGTRDEVGDRAISILRRAKEICKRPLGVGFGISKADHVRKLISEGADGVIVGSAIVELVEKYGINADRFIEEKVRELAMGIEG